MQLVEVIVGGLALGSIYAVVALGFVVVYKTSGVLNFAHGALGAAGGLIMASLVTDGGFGIGALAGANPLLGLADSVWGWGLNLALAVVLAAGLGVVVERLAVRPMLGRDLFTVLLATIGASIVLQVVVNRAPISRSLRIPWGVGTWEVAGVTVAQSSAMALGLGAGCFLCLLAFDRTRMGLAAQAVASDREAAMAQGIDPGRIYAVTWALAAGLATLAAVAFSFSPRGNGSIATGVTESLFFRALPVIAIGGWDSYRGAYLAGLAIGVIQVGSGWALASYVNVLGAGYPTVIPYLLMMVVLLVRPAGTFGRLAVRRV